jgi:hypothetical protein
MEWTQNDAFVVVLFSSGCIGVVPRLASSFLKVYNPTVDNIPRYDQQMWEHYA